MKATYVYLAIGAIVVIAVIWYYVQTAPAKAATTAATTQAATEQAAIGAAANVTNTLINSLTE